MDPVSTLVRIRALVKEFNACNNHDDRHYVAYELTELMAALDEWMSKGGYSPWLVTD